MTEDQYASWITATANAVRLAVNVNEADRQKANLQTATTVLAELLADYRAIAEGVTVLRPLGWEGRSVNPDVRNSLQEARQTLDNSSVTMAIKGLEKFRSDVKTDLTTYWRQRASERLGNVAELQILAGTLSEVEGLAELSGNLESVLGELARTQDMIPSGRSALLLSDAETILRNLEDSLQPDTVRRFLIAVARGGAPLELLTGDVLSWLRSHNAAQSFKVVAGPPVNPTDD
jgi:hypothetical protein